MRRDWFARLLLILLILAVAAGTALVLVELSRVRKLQLRTMRMLEQTRRTASPLRAEEGSPPRTGGVFANAGFFVPGAPVGGRLCESISADPPGLNPIISNEATAAGIYSLCMAQLAERSLEHPDGEYLPMMAESWEISPDRLAYRIRLRRGIMWDAYTDPATGEKVPAKEVTADDFRFFVNVLRDENVNCAPLRGYYQDLDGIEVKGRYEFVVRWKRPFYGSLSATLGMSPLPEHYYHNYPGPFDGRRFNDDHRRNAFIVGCGPYRFERW